MAQGVPEIQVAQSVTFEDASHLTSPVFPSDNRSTRVSKQLEVIQSRLPRNGQVCSYIQARGGLAAAKISAIVAIR